MNQVMVICSFRQTPVKKTYKKNLVQDTKEKTNLTLIQSEFRNTKFQLHCKIKKNNKNNKKSSLSVIADGHWENFYNFGYTSPNDHQT